MFNGNNANNASYCSSPIAVTPAPAGVLGADALVRVGKIGLRVSGKAWMFSAVRASPQEQFFMLRTQWGVEGIYQF